MTSPLLFLAAIGLVAVVTCAAIVTALGAHDLPSASAHALTLRAPAALLVRY